MNHGDKVALPINFTERKVCPEITWHVLIDCNRTLISILGARINSSLVKFLYKDQLDVYLLSKMQASRTSSMR
jgi:hypothetical protein